MGTLIHCWRKLVQISTAIMETSMGTTQQTKNRPTTRPSKPTVGTQPKEMEAASERHTYTSTWEAALLTTPRHGIDLHGR